MPRRGQRLAGTPDGVVTAASGGRDERRAAQLRVSVEPKAGEGLEEGTEGSEMGMCSGGSVKRRQLWKRAEPVGALKAGEARGDPRTSGDKKRRQQVGKELGAGVWVAKGGPWCRTWPCFAVRPG